MVGVDFSKFGKIEYRDNINYLYLKEITGREIWHAIDVLNIKDNVASTTLLTRLGL